ncbi:MAG: hypothetical protein ABIR52_14665 [Casimicrobiaceae bacterium]
MAAASAEAAFEGQSTVTTGGLEYVGRGDVGGGIGSGRYTLGTCFSLGASTTCTLSGSYVETAQSDHAPGAGGTFTMRLVYPGTGVSPVVAVSDTPGDDILRFMDTANAQFLLDVYPASGGQFSGVYPDNPFPNSIQFSAFLDGPTVSCTGVSVAQCRVGQVGLVPGAVIQGGVKPFAFSIPGNFAEHPPTVEVVEYYNADLDHYFITWIAAEQAHLDAGLTPTLWKRTGYKFRVYTVNPAGTSPVCRYYIPPGKGDSHFFGRGTVECDATGAAHPDFVLEERNFMFVYLPGVGRCPSGTTLVYRVFSNRADANHRYMTDPAVRDQMVAKGWLAEGDGPDQVVMCAPM